MESDGKAMYFTTNPVVGACCMTVRIEWCMRDSELAV